MQRGFRSHFFLPFFMSDNSRVRVSIVGVVIVALFASLVARLWFLQMGPEKALGQEAVQLYTRVIRTESPRGRIRDRDGRILVQDRVAWAVTVDRKLKPATLQMVLGQLSELLATPVARLQANFDDVRQSPLKPAVVALDVPLRTRIALEEKHDDYPGVSVSEVTVRSYPMADQLHDPAFAAQLLGYVGEIGPDQLKKLKAQGYEGGDTIGRDGVESVYERDLRGRPEEITVQVDPRGQQVGAPIATDRGTVGNDVWLTIDSRVQYAAERALAEGITVARTHPEDERIPNGPKLHADAGGVVVLDADSGDVVAMASNPAFPPENWVAGVNKGDFAALSNPLSFYPLLNRVTQGQYQPGSTFKLVSGLAMTRFGIRRPFDYFADNGKVHIGNLDFKNDNGVVNGPVDLARALTVSSDVYFYTVGDSFWNRWNANDPTGLGLEQQARDLGFGAPTGIELDESTGRVPDPEWKKQYAEQNYKTDQERRDYSTWYPGDMVQLAVGQRDIYVTPLQLANAYATFTNGGTRYTPHVGFAVKNPANGKTERTIDPKPKAHVTFDGTGRDQMLQGFANVVADKSGTAYNAFQGFNTGLVPVAGKTGTAQVAGKQPTSWFVSYFTANGHRYVALAVVEEGGYGAVTAAPIVRKVIEAILDPAHAVQQAGAPVVVASGGRD